LASETKDSLTDQQKEKLKNITHSGNRILKLIETILDIRTIKNSKIPINLEEVTLNRLIVESFEEAKHFAREKKLSIISNMPTNEELWVMADRSYLKKLLIN
jgi:signal transduction histidine kinase